ncbi:unnamed protein product [Discula destructiva]
MADIPHSSDSAAPVKDSALPTTLQPATENPFAQKSATSDTTTKPADAAADAPAATVNGGDAAPSTTAGASTAPASNGDGVNGAAVNTKSALSEENKQASAPASDVMTGALPLADDQSKPASSLPKPALSTEKDGVEDTAGADTAPKLTAPTGSIPAADSKKDTTNSIVDNKDAPTGVSANEPTQPSSGSHEAEKKETVLSTGPASEDKPSVTASTTVPIEKEDIEMKDAALPPAAEKPSVSAPAPDTNTAPVATTAPVSDMSGVTGVTGATEAPTTTPALATPATAAAEATGAKRKADTDNTEEPATKKHKGAFSRAMDKAKEAVQEVKEKAKPGRKPGKKAKKETAPPPVGRTERKTRSQARAGAE